MKYNLKNKLFTARNSYFFKMFFLYTPFSIILIILCSSILVSLFEKSMQPELLNVHRALLKQSQSATDNHILEKINSIVIEKYRNMFRNAALSEFFSPDVLSSGAVFNLQHELTDTVLNANKYEEIIESINLYREADGIILSSKNGLIRNNNTGYPIPLLNYETLNKITLEEGRFWLCPDSTLKEGGKNDIITYIQPVPVGYNASYRLGYVVININATNLFKSIQALSSSNSTLCVIDSEYNLFAHNDPQLLYQPLNLDVSIKNDILEQDNGTLYTSINNSKSTILWIKSNVNGWKYVAIVPSDVLNRKVFVIRNTSIILILVFIVLGIIGAGLITQRLYKPINILVKAARELFDIRDKSINELSLMSKVIPDLSGQANQIKKTIEKNRDLILIKTVQDILAGNVKDIDDLRERLSAINCRMDFDKFRILICEINPEQAGHLTFEQKEYIFYYLIDMINSQLSTYCVSLSISTINNRIVSIVNFPESVHIVNILPAIVNGMGSFLGIQINIAVGVQHSNPLELSSNYSGTEDYLKYKFIYGFGNIFPGEAVESWERNNDAGGFEDHLAEKIVSWLQKAKNENMKDEFSTLIIEIQNQKFSYSFTRDLLLNIIGLIVQNSREHGVTLHDLDKNGIYKRFKSIESIHEYFNWVQSIISTYTEHVGNQSQTSHYSDLAAKISDYISSNIDKQISLNIVAEQFSLSPWYLSKIFKDITGSSFSDYVIVRKFKKAAELLLSENKTDVSDIAARLGYYNLPYFTKIFKERYGVTPTLYRKKRIPGGVAYEKK